jgi:hypothetical protein
VDKGPKLKQMDTIFGTRNISLLYRAGSLATVSRPILKYKLDLVGVKEVRRDRVGTEQVGEKYNFLWKRE